MSRRAPEQTDKEEAPSIGGAKTHLLWIWRYWSGNERVLVVLAFLTLVSTAVAVAYPPVFRWVIDRLNEVVPMLKDPGRITMKALFEPLPL